MQTERIRFYTSVIKLPLHHPLILAKQVATAAIMSGDRFALGVGASWAPEEYEFCGVDWSRRGRIMTESIEVLRPGAERRDGRLPRGDLRLRARSSPGPPPARR